LRIITWQGETPRVQDRSGLGPFLKQHAIREIIIAARKECKTLLAGRSILVQLLQALPVVRADLRLIKKALIQWLEKLENCDQVFAGR
jgi:K+-sensing histidine kinase KdpD